MVLLPTLCSVVYEEDETACECGTGDEEGNGKLGHTNIKTMVAVTVFHVVYEEDETVCECGTGDEEGKGKLGHTNMKTMVAVTIFHKCNN